MQCYVCSVGKETESVTQDIRWLTG